METMKEQFIAKIINFIHFNMNVQKKAKICATLVMIFFILLILEPIIFGTHSMVVSLFIAMAIGLFIALWLFMYYMFSEYFSYKKLRKKKNEKQQDC